MNSDDRALELMIQLQSSVPYEKLELDSVFGRMDHHNYSLTDRYTIKQDQMWYLCKYIINILVPQIEKELPNYNIRSAHLIAGVYDTTTIQIYVCVKEGGISKPTQVREFSRKLLSWAISFEGVCSYQHNDNWKYKMSIRLAAVCNEDLDLLGFDVKTVHLDNFRDWLRWVGA